MQANWVAYVYDFDFVSPSGGEQTFTAPWAGYYKLEVWGAQGGCKTSSNCRGYGSYSVGVYNASKNSVLKVYVGGIGTEIAAANSSTMYSGGYNGGGGAYKNCGQSADSIGSGGGATHIATVSGLLKNLSSYRNTGGTNISNEILIVAGGGGGNGHYLSDVNNIITSFGGSGGGMTGITGDYGHNTWGNGGGGTQTAGGTAYGATAYNNRWGTNGAFGTGADAVYSREGGAGGGGGWYGGASGSCLGAGGGGSGYVGSSNLLSGAGVAKHMTCYSCTTSSVESTRTNSNTNVSATATSDYSKTGNGYARITYLGASI